MSHPEQDDPNRNHPVMAADRDRVEPVPRRIRGFVAGRVVFDTTQAACVQACIARADCAAVTYNARSRACFLKAAASGPVPFPGALSGPVVAADPALQDRATGRLAGAGLDMLPVEPPEPAPSLLAAYRARAPWLEGRLIITPHSAYLTPEANCDIRVKSAETMRAALVEGRPRNVIAPDMP